MKRLIVIFLLSLVSCTNDNNNEKPQTNTKELAKIIQTVIENGILKEKITFTYDNNLLKSDSFFNPLGILQGYDVWNYNSKNLVASITNYNSNHEVQKESKYTYDSDDRMTQSYRLEKGANYAKTTNFIFQNNIIISESTYGTSSSIKKFHLNNNNYVYQESSEDGTVNTQIDFDSNNNPISTKFYNSVTTYTYDESYDKINFNKIFSNLFGENHLNIVLWHNNLIDAVGSFSNNLILEESSSGFLIEYIYDFDDDGYIMKRKQYYNGELNSEIQFIYK